jgi:hypothetical protein
MLAWVRRLSLTATERGLLYLGASFLGPEMLTLGINASGQIKGQARGRPSEALQAWTSTTVVDDSDAWHLIGAGIDLAAGKAITFIDDAALALVPLGGTPGGAYESATFTPPTTRVFEAVNASSDSALAVNAGSFGNPWSGDIAAISVYPALMSAQTVNAIWRAGRRGSFR